MKDPFSHSSRWDSVGLDCDSCTHVSKSEWPNKDQSYDCHLHNLSLRIEIAKNGYKEGEWFCVDFENNGGDPNGVKEFEYQVAKDTWKDKKCKENKILLIRIPHFVAFYDLDRYIRMILKRKSLLKDDPGAIYNNYSHNKNIYE